MIEDNGDIIRAIGYVTYFSAHLEALIEKMVEELEPVKQYKGRRQVSDRIKHAKKALRKLDADKFDDLIGDLHTCLDIFDDRNKWIHRTLFGGQGKADFLRSSDPNIPDMDAHSSEVCQLANELDSYRREMHRSVRLDVPRAVSNYKR